MFFNYTEARIGFKQSRSYTFIKRCLIALYNDSRSLGKRAMAILPEKHVEKRQR